MNIYKKIKSPIGILTLIANEKSLIALYIADEDAPLVEAALKNEKHPVLIKAEAQLKEYFSGKRLIFDLPLNPKGTEFQNKAWRALSKIPYGDIWSYGKQAQFLKAPNAQRAVGGANGRNPIPIIIPCHRVIGSTGKLTGFSGGMEIKIFLLKLEGHEIDTEKLLLLRTT